MKQEASTKQMFACVPFALQEDCIEESCKVSPDFKRQVKVVSQSKSSIHT